MRFDVGDRRHHSADRLREAPGHEAPQNGHVAGLEVVGAEAVDQGDDDPLVAPDQGRTAGEAGAVLPVRRGGRADQADGQEE
jgi:hypothetical protein